MKTLNEQPSVIRISADTLARVAPFAAHRSVRYYFNGIYVMPDLEGGAIAVATNGNIIVCSRDPEGVCDRPAILPITDRRNKAALKPRGSVSMTDEGTIFAAERNAVYFVCPEGEIEGKFPDVKAVFGRPENYTRGIVGVFDLPLMARIQKAARYTPVVFWTKKTDGDADCQAAAFSIADKLFGLVMPLRVDPKDKSIDSVFPRALIAEKPEEAAKPARKLKKAA